MLDALKFVNRATDEKSVIRALTHICVHDGKLQGADSKIALETECPELAGFSFTAPAEKFVKAVTGCNGEPKIEVNADGTIKISRSRFRVTLPCLKTEDYPITAFKTEDAVKITTSVGFLQALKKVKPFISQDASRPWSLGVWVSEGYVYATNNVSMARAPVEWNGPSLNLPGYAVDQLLDIDQPIDEIWASAAAVSFKFKNGWMRSQLYVDGWPPSIASMFQADRVYEQVPDGLKDAVERIIPFCPDSKFPTIYFKDGGITTANGLQSAEIGFDWAGVGVYRAEILQLVLGVARHWTPQAYPKPVFFKGDGVEGMMVGVKT